MTTRIDTVPGIMERLYALVAELEAAFPGRPFTPDGHLVGSLGEVLASHYYDLDLLPCSTACHDAQTRDGRLVQVKATQGTSVALRAEPDHLLVILLKRDGTIEELYNGPGALAWTNCGKQQKNGQSPISVSKLRTLMRDIPSEQRLPRAIESRNAEAD
ncbi:MAG: hypothetical protein ABI779_15740 [Acidobacteriota bacterium]